MLVSVAVKTIVSAGVDAVLSMYRYNSLLEEVIGTVYSPFNLVYSVLLFSVSVSYVAARTQPEVPP